MFIDTELELINKQMEYPKFFSSQASTWKSPLYLDEEVIKQIDVMEIVSGFHYSEGVKMGHGISAPLSQLAKGFEKLFNFKFSDVYKKEEEVIKRKPNKLTGFLDRLQEAIKRKSKSDGFQP